MKMKIIAAWLMCGSALFATFPTDVKTTALDFIQTSALLQPIDKTQLTAAITSLCDTGYVEFTNDVNHSMADLTLGVMEMSFALMARQNQVSMIYGISLHPLPDLSIRYNGYTPDISSPLLTPEKVASVNLRVQASEAILSSPGAAGWLYFSYSSDALTAFQANPNNQAQASNIQNVPLNHPMLTRVPLVAAPPANLEGVLYYVRDMTGRIYHFATNIPDQTSESPTTLKMWFLFNKDPIGINYTNAFHQFFLMNQGGYQ
ncbi:MAG: hypothetical protein KBC64_08035 [Simkaniaceae bacterium]|nr:hypothetical protein [Simkaniaceae bacterium]